MLADSMRRLLADKLDMEVREEARLSESGIPSDLWSNLAELGVIGALFPETIGGFGGSAWDVATVFEQAGRALVPGPFLGTLMAGHLLAQAGEAELLEKVIGGELIVTCAVPGSPSASPNLQIESKQGSTRLTGALEAVEYASAAEYVVAVFHSDSSPSAVLLKLVQEGCTVRSYPMIDLGTGADIHLESVSVELLATNVDDIKTTLAIGVLACCWEAVGLMSEIFEQTLEYLRTRQQFGTPIGKFQALQHRMADLAIELEQARSSAINAASHFGSDPRERDRFCSAAKYSVGSIGQRVAEEAIQLHGGIGMTWELPLSHYAKRLIMLNQVLGDDDLHLSRFVELSTAA